MEIQTNIKALSNKGIITILENSGSVSLFGDETRAELEQILQLNVNDDTIDEIEIILELNGE